MSRHVFTEDDLDRDLARREARLREVLKDHPAELAEYDASMKNLRLGITGAKSAWQALSEHQRIIVQQMAKTGGRLEKMPGGTRYTLTRAWGRGSPRILVPTVRALVARRLLDLDGGAMDPEFAAVLSEHGSFVVKHGQ